MKALQQRNSQDGMVFHNTKEARIYAEDNVQKERIERSRAMLSACITEKRCRIIELGCGTLDISGPFAKKHDVIGVECNPEAVRVACHRWPLAHMNTASLQPETCDVIVLCEFLEHIPNPSELVSEWLPLAKYCVISHPLNGDVTGDLSAGEHQWSFDEADFKNWFAIGGHKLENNNTFRMGGYQIIIGRGKRIE